MKNILIISLLLISSPLLSGHHEKVKVWRQTQSEDITEKRRPDLWEKYNSSTETKLNKH